MAQLFLRIFEELRFQFPQQTLRWLVAVTVRSHRNDGFPMDRNLVGAANFTIRTQVDSLVSHLIVDGSTHASATTIGPMEVASIQVHETVSVLVLLQTPSSRREIGPIRSLFTLGLLA